MVDDNSDEMLAARLDSALRAGLDHDRVDVPTLLQGCRRRARRVRTQRIAGVTGAAILIVGLPVGYQVVNPGAGASAPPAALLPSSSRPAGTRGPGTIGPPNPTAVPSAVPPSAGVSAPTGSSLTSSSSASRAIPDAFAFTAAELPAGLVLGRDAPSSGSALVEGQDCDGLARSPRPSAGRQWLWSGSPNTAGDLSVSLTVTGWAEGSADAAFTAAVGESDSCSWKVPQKPHALTDAGADQSWASTSDVDGRHYAIALVRVGNGVAGVEVRHPRSATAAAALADDLVRLQVAHLRSGVLNGAS